MLNLLRVLYLLILFVFASSNAFAAVTTQGTTIQTTFSVDFVVSGGSTQTENLNSQQFLTDRKIDVHVTATNDNTTTNAKPVYPNAASGTGTTLLFSVKNEGNGPQSYTLVATVDDSANDIFVTDGSEIYLSSDTTCDGIGVNGDAAYSTRIDLAAEATQYVCVRITGAVRANNLVAQDENANIVLTATTTNDGTTTPTTSDSGSSFTSGTVQNVFSDADGDNDGIYDGIHADTGYFKIVKVALTTSVSYLVIYDNNSNGEGYGCTTTASGSAVANAKAIPGSCIEFTYTISNAASSATADNVVLTITTPATLRYQGEGAGGAEATANDSASGCNHTGGFTTAAVVGTTTGATITCNITNLVGGGSRTFKFRASVE